jgi:hypothetical protein
LQTSLKVDTIQPMNFQYLRAIIIDINEINSISGLIRENHEKKLLQQSSVRGGFVWIL